MKWRCDLDASRILRGYTQIQNNEVQPGDVVFQDKPDLPRGEYRWNGEMFVPAKAPTPFTPDGPDPWYAMYRLCRRLEKQNIINLPNPVKVWMDYYRRSFTNDPDREA